MIIGWYGLSSKNLTASSFRVLDDLFSQKEILIVLISNRLTFSLLAYNNSERQEPILLGPGQCLFSTLRTRVSESEFFRQKKEPFTLKSSGAVLGGWESMTDKWSSSSASSAGRSSEWKLLDDTQECVACRWSKFCKKQRQDNCFQF